MTRSVLEPIYLGRDRQNAIRGLDVVASRRLLADHTTVDGLLELGIGAPPGSPPPGGFADAVGRRRIGQQRFKDDLLRRFGTTCAFTGPQPTEVLDAAHLYRFADAPEHHLDGGLLMRTDLHRLFDAFRLTVDTSDWTIRLDPRLAAFPGPWGLDGRPLLVPETLRPRQNFLDLHRAEAARRWGLAGG